MQLPFLQTHGDRRPPGPLCANPPPQAPKMKSDFNMKVSLAHNQAQRGPRIGHTLVVEILGFFYADVAALHFGGVFCFFLLFSGMFSIYFLDWEFRLKKRFELGGSGTDTYMLLCWCN